MLKARLILISFIFIFFLQMFVFAEESSSTLKSPEYDAWLCDNYQVAINTYTVALKDIKDEKIEIKIQIQKNLATIYKQIGDYEKVRDFYEKIIKTDKSVQSYSELGTICYYLDDLTDAESYLKKSVDIDTTTFEGNFNLARTYFEKKDFEKAIFYFNKTTEIHSNFAAAYYYLGECYKAIGDIKNALKFYETAIKKDSYFVEARVPMMDTYLNEKEYENTSTQIYKIQNVYPEYQKANQILAEIRPALSKDDKVILPSNHFKASFRKFQTATDRTNIPFIRVGINTNDVTGDPNKTNKFVFKSNGDFSFMAGGKVVLNGKKNTTYTIKLKGNKLSLENIKTKKFFSKLKLVPKQDTKNAFMIQKIEFGKDSPWKGTATGQYRGSIELNSLGNTIAVVNIVNVEEYLYSVIACETISWWPIECHKAQAVLARNHIFYKKQNASSHKKDGYDVCSGQHCQVYRGISSEFDNMNKAVNATRGEVLVYDGKLVNGFFHSNSGGYTQGSKNVKGWRDVPYLQDVFGGYGDTKESRSPYDIEQWLKSYPSVYSNDISLSRTSATFRWIRIVKPEFIEEKVNKDQSIGKIKNIIVLKRSPSGHVNKIKFEGTTGDFVVEKENKIRYYLGLGSLRSTLFWLEKKYKKDEIVEFTIYGGGWGHGIGMDQTGAAGMAKQGFSYEDILKFYYRGTEIHKKGY